MTSRAAASPTTSWSAASHRRRLRDDGELRRERLSQAAPRRRRRGGDLGRRGRDGRRRQPRLRGRPRRGTAGLAEERTSSAFGPSSRASPSGARTRPGRSPIDVSCVLDLAPRSPGRVPRGTTSPPARRQCSTRDTKRSVAAAPEDATASTPGASTLAWSQSARSGRFPRHAGGGALEIRPLLRLLRWK